MKNFRSILLVSAAMFAAACGRDSAKTDDALRNDLALASQAQPYNPQQFMSPTEAGYGPNGYQQPYQTAQGGYYPQPQVAQPVYAPAPRPRATVRRRDSSRLWARRCALQIILEIRRI